MKTKKSLFQKAVVITLISASLLSLTPKRSQAFVGAAAGSVPLVLVAAGIELAGGGGMLLGLLNPLNWSLPNWLNGSDEIIDTLGMVAGCTAEFAGFVLLDSNQQVSPQFTALTDTSAKNLGVTAEEMASYNSELPQVNAIFQSIVSDTEKQAPASSAKDLVSFANGEWTTFGQAALSAATESALAKIRTGLAQSLNRAAAH